MLTAVQRDPSKCSTRSVDRYRARIRLTKWGRSWHCLWQASTGTGWVTSAVGPSGLQQQRQEDQDVVKSPWKQEAFTDRKQWIEPEPPSSPSFCRGPDTCLLFGISLLSRLLLYLLSAVSDCKRFPLWGFDLCTFPSLGQALCSSPHRK